MKQGKIYFENSYLCSLKSLIESQEKIAPVFNEVQEKVKSLEESRIDVIKGAFSAYVEGLEEVILIMRVGPKRTGN